MKPTALLAFTAALASLVGCQDRGVQPRRVVAGDSADQVYAGMQTDITRNGVRVSHVEADSAWMYQARQVADLKHMKIIFFDSTGAVVSTVTAARGQYNSRDQSLDARGDVVATSSQGRVLRTAHLIFDQTRNRVNSDTAFTSTSPKGNLSGAWFEADPGFKNVDVHAPRGRAKGKGFTIPGQTGGESR